MVLSVAGLLVTAPGEAGPARAAASSLHDTSVITFRVLLFFMSFMAFMFKLCDKRLVTSTREQQPTDCRNWRERPTLKRFTWSAPRL
jgi:hypothetical protein